MRATHRHSFVVLFIMLYFPVVLYKVVLTFIESGDEILRLVFTSDGVGVGVVSGVVRALMT